MQYFEIYVGGQFKKTSQVLSVVNPYDGSIVAKTYLGEAKDLELAISQAKIVEKELKYLASYKKSRVLNSIAEALEKDKINFAELLCKESAKPIKYAIGEVERAIQTFVVAAEETKRLPKEYLDLDWTEAGENKEGLVKYFPIGLVAGISPFNFPLNLAVHKIAPAIAAGCPIILKPSSSTPLSMLKLAQIIDQTDLPKGVVTILPMDRKTGNILVTDDRFKLLSFTGSPLVGWKMKKDSGKKKVVLELGGNAGVIVTETADMEHAVNKCVDGAFAYSGQVCIHTQRIYVHQNVFDKFCERFIAETQRLKMGDPLNPETDISSMIDEHNAIRVEDWVKEALCGGAKLLAGGSRKRAYFQPTVLNHTKDSMKVCSEEVFGPVVILEPYDEFIEAVGRVNGGRFGLQAGVFTNKLDEMDMAFSELDVGGVIVNDVPTFRVDHMPYGGLKDSGLGREGIKYAIHDMLEPKILVKNFK